MIVATPSIDFGEVVHVRPAAAGSKVLVVCEHASNRVPTGMRDLGLSGEALQSHAAWDPGALGVAEAMADQMSAALVQGGVSRLVYDCNRPPEAPSAMPARVEKYGIPANEALSAEMRRERVMQVYEQFAAALARQIKDARAELKLMVTIHSFNPTFHGKVRGVEVGILHGKDNRFASAMMEKVPGDFPFVARLNEPYSAADGVAYTLDLHGVANGLLNVMIEIRNDLIRSTEQQKEVASKLVPWITGALAEFESGKAP
ncbi:MAG: N-formylglutamate amidohydrolase [Rhodobacteraceae bacterium]|nr:N-formylglutamate amidohydrolase [Paracoccaceae bacterium]